MYTHQKSIHPIYLLKVLSTIAITIFLSACAKTTPEITADALYEPANKALALFSQSLDNTSYNDFLRNNVLHNKENTNNNKQIAIQTNTKLSTNSNRSANSIHNTNPYSLTGSIRFTTDDNSNRTTYLLWGNGGYPLRLDLQAGIGASVAKIMETSEEILLYFPLEQKAIYTLPRTALNNLLSLDAPIPLTFLDLSFLARGALSSYFHNIMYTEQLEILANAVISQHNTFLQNSTQVQSTTAQKFTASTPLSLGNLVTSHLVFVPKESTGGEYTFKWLRKPLISAKNLQTQSSGEAYSNTPISTTTQTPNIHEKPQNTTQSSTDTTHEHTLVNSLGKAFEYHPFFNKITINNDGLPIQYTIHNDWHVSIQYMEIEQNQKKVHVPYRIKIDSLQNDTNVIMLIKEHNATNIYPQEQVNLLLPDNTTVETYNF